MNIIHAHFKVKPEYRNMFLEHVKPLIEGSQAEEGNISYRLFEDTEIHNTFIMVEEWKDQSAIDFHNQTTHFKQFGQVAGDFFLEPPEVVTYKVTN
ncbi:putative quinol monooxygenase [Aquibacillus albus]|uniref:Quinol monooxygenase YgiN n=1 Tax=Aquibacillus albus TaxID=1168171 RepID=A0ABS2MYH2_9BACI|nr:putative quinol monooxygenase [Aquibacillus albus]MBM7570886.1 quinol monooxygenase YgiN [Aquibacillus albus]